MLLEYFGEQHTHDCLQCDVCLAQRGALVTPQGQQSARQQIVSLLTDHQPHHITEILRLQLPTEEVNAALTHLIQEEQVYQSDGYLTLH